MSTTFVTKEAYKIVCNNCKAPLLKDEYSVLFTVDEPESEPEDYGWHDGLCPKCVFERDHKIYGGLFKED